MKVCGMALCLCLVSLRAIKGFQPLKTIPFVPYSRPFGRLLSSKPDFPEGYKRPDQIELPLDKLSFSYAKSSGPGGQNVNKLNTKAEVRFVVREATW